MKFIYRGTDYDLEFINFVIAHIKDFKIHSWRRFLRGSKRCMSYLVYWLVLLVPFGLLCAALIAVFYWVGFLGIFDVIVLSLSVFLGSFLLLVIKDIWDKEQTRHELLIKQHSLYSNAVSSFECSLVECVKYCNLNLSEDAASPFSCESCFEQFVEEIQDSSTGQINLKGIRIDTDLMLSTITFLEGALDSTKIVDLDDDTLKINFDYTRKDIHYLQENAFIKNTRGALDATRDIVCDSYSIFAKIRRPWRYPMDNKANQDFDDWLQSHERKAS